jgi:hypothetical protein
MENFKFARVCSATGRGMNQGYCCCDGDFYFAEDADLLAWLRSDENAGYEGMSDEFVMADAYEGEMYYYTEWEELDEDGWYESLHRDGREAVWIDA